MNATEPTFIREGLCAMAQTETHSVVVPVFREAEGLKEFHRRLTAAIGDLPDYEIIYVEDHSPDDTYEVLRTLARTDAHTRVLRLSRRYGHQLSLTAGIDFARGDTVTVMDGDLQHPPEVVPRMIEAWRGGADVVFAIKKTSRVESVGKRQIAKAFYRTMRMMSDVDIPAQAQDFRLTSRRATDALRSMREHHRYLRGLAGWIGFERAFVDYQPEERFAGSTKYSLPRMMQLAMDGIFSFSTRPLTVATWVGTTLATLGIVYAIVLAVQYLLGEVVVPGYTSLFVALLVFSGIQLITLGVLGEYVGRIYDEVRDRPLYLVEDAIGFSSETGAEMVPEASGHTSRPANR
jgi:glycosyltransferase involved in cell wall biosynthesis